MAKSPILSVQTPEERKAYVDKLRQLYLEGRLDEALFVNATVTDRLLADLFPQKQDRPRRRKTT